MINLSPFPRSEERKIEREREKEKEEEKEKKPLRIILPELHSSVIYGPELPHPSACKAESQHR